MEEDVQSRSYGTDTADTEAIIDEEDYNKKDNLKPVFLNKIGNVHCFFHKENGVPRICIGP